MPGSVATRFEHNIAQMSCPIPFFEGTVHVYVILADPITLIDAPTNLPDSIEGFEAGLGELGLAVTDIKRILCTHAHTDHMGMARYIQDRTDCEFWVHADDADSCRRFPEASQERHEYSKRQLREWAIPEEIVLEMLNRTWDPNGIAQSVNVTRELQDRDRIAFEGMELETLHVPGHSTGHVVFYEPESAFLVSGDHVLPSIIPFAEIQYLDPEGTRRFAGLNHFLRSQKRLRRMHISTIYPAHGKVIEQPWSAIESIQLFHEKRLKQVERALRKGSGTVHGLADVIYKGRLGRRNLRHRLMLIMGCLDVLEERGRISSERPPGSAWRFRLLPKSSA